MTASNPNLLGWLIRKGSIVLVLLCSPCVVFVLYACHHLGGDVSDNVRGVMTRNCSGLRTDKLETIKGTNHNPTTEMQLPFRLRKKFIFTRKQLNSNNTFEDEPFELSNITATQIVKLNKTKEDVAKIHSEIWKRPADVTELPIPSYDGRYFMNSKSKCSTENPPLFLILVQTAVYNNMARNSIRQSWANKHFLQAHSMHVVFLVGLERNKQKLHALVNEQQLYGDLVQGAFMDTYRNLTHKSVLGLRWAAEYCRQAKFVVRADDDVFLNPFRLIELMETKLKDKTRHIWCTVKSNSVIQRDRYQKWRINEHEFEGFYAYPVAHCNGPFSIITNDLIPELFEASKITPLFWIEDVYMSGMLPYVVGNCSLMTQYYVVYNDSNMVYACFTKKSDCIIVASYPHTPDQLGELWITCLYYYRKRAGILLEEARTRNETTI